MEVRVERFDEVSAIWDVTDVTTDEQGNLKLWTEVLEDIPSGSQSFRKVMMALYNEGSWAACIVLDEESRYKLRNDL